MVAPVLSSPALRLAVTSARGRPHLRASGDVLQGQVDCRFPAVADVVGVAPGTAAVRHPPGLERVSSQLNLHRLRCVAKVDGHRFPLSKGRFKSSFADASRPEYTYSVSYTGVGLSEISAFTGLGVPPRRFRLVAPVFIFRSPVFISASLLAACP